jgi:hypothetical protein
MTLPEKLEIVVQEALKTVREHPQHEYGPANRKKLIDVFFELGTPTAVLARRWLAVLSAKKVLHLYAEPNYPERYYEQIKAFPEEEWQQVQEQMRYIHPQEALKLAETVLLGEANAVNVGRIANETHYYVGHWKSYQPVAAVFAELAGNRALGEAAWPEGNPFWNLHLYTQPNSSPYVEFDLDWALSRSGDAAANAFVAQCCVVNTRQPNSQADANGEYDAWVKNPVLDSQTALSFWQWWLLEAVPQAWTKAEQPDI